LPVDAARDPALCPSQIRAKPQIERGFSNNEMWEFHALASLGLNIDEQKAVDRFRKNVAEPSMTSLVVLDFWAEWCGPCKALTPLLEKVAAQYADKGVILAKVNVDEEPFIAQQFQVKSIPTVYAIFQGQPVADLTNARSESQLKGLLDQLLAKLPIQGAGGEAAQDITPLLTMAEEVLEAGDGERAASIFAQILDLAPDNVEAIAGLVRALVVAGQIEEAEALLGDLPPELASTPPLERARTALELARDRPDDSVLAALRSAATERPADMDAQFDFAGAAFAAGERETAADTLLKMIAADREWNEGAAKAKLLQIFEAIGLEDPWVAATRRRLSTILFG
jgi:putative thioredoxin